MGNRSDPIPASWKLSQWRRAPVAVALIAVVLAGLVTAGASERRGPEIIGLIIFLLDLVGAAYSWRAARTSPSGPAPWRLIGAGRVASAVSGIFLACGGFSSTTAWWNAAELARMLMFLLISAGVFTSILRQFTGRSRTALLAELSTVLAAGFMAIWYFVIEPVLAHQSLATVRIATIGWPLGDVLLLVAVASIVLGGAVTRFATPITVFAVSLALYLAADLAWMVNSTDGKPFTHDLRVLAGFTIASLFMTVAPVLTVARSGLPYTVRTSRPPLWATYLPMAAMLAGCLIMAVVTVLEGQLLPWGGLVCGLTAMTGAAAWRQLIFVGHSRDQLTTDALTGLANRSGLDEALDRAAGRGEPAALLLIDLDGFKLVNDAYGHASGDVFLAHVGRQLRAAVRDVDVCARIGGDEFAVLLAGTGHVNDAIAAAQRILATAAAHPAGIDNDLVPVRASIGIATARPGYDSKTLLRQADTAMYHIKRAGSHRYARYETSMIDQRADDAVLAEDLQHALPRGELHVVYQPQVDLVTGRPIAAEALLRWQHPTRGAISPVRFIPVAERSGAINDIGLWVLEQSLVQLAALPDPPAGGEPMHISVNLSPRQLREPTIVHDILAVLDRVGGDPRHLVLEVTESALVDETGGIAALRALREHGIRIAIDDFGTGYSSLQYLTRLPVDILKIDRSFVAELDNTPEGSAVAGAVIRLSQVLHLSTVAEGIETEQQAAELRELGCDIAQGYLFAKPLSPADFADFLTAAALPEASGF
ncbi:putative bifunctional diguanylate cyclase/phosphodiesterase [Actinoplanes palleronii]|uniref:Bifunctional diguanylate cyclase/phosphodiesterase n=1 Tax=Actinoplanes palleronii TaxID=113570 RepID=A0ABQ4BJ24_9ACTN|nr:bifunctional diguanylate cyclase/phosphodiesterase [Actinoplanes palleronii]GIE70674.1 bifunctional diguanylate cyclase/phosphodiesterase [Actinoplanes palleronii]